MVCSGGKLLAAVRGCGPACIVDAHAISGGGKVAGLRNDHAFVWSQAGGFVDFPSLPGAQYSEAQGVDNAGQVVINTFYSAGPRAGVSVAPGVMQNLGSLPGKPYTTATAINDNGQVVGFAQ